MITKTFGIDFDSYGGALTLDPSEVDDKQLPSGLWERTHEDGWTIRGSISEDYYVWVNDFEAEHPTLGQVHGNFESIVYATSEEAFDHFWTHHRPNAWDYRDI